MELEFCKLQILLFYTGNVAKAGYRVGMISMGPIQNRVKRLTDTWKRGLLTNMHIWSIYSKCIGSPWGVFLTW